MGKVKKQKQPKLYLRTSWTLISPILRAAEIPVMWFWHKNRHCSVDQNWDSRNNPSHLLSVVECQDNLAGEKRSVATECPHAKNEPKFLIRLFTKFNSNWATDLNVRTKIMKL